MWWMCLPVVCLLHVAAPPVDVEREAERFEAVLEVEVEEWADKRRSPTV